MKYLPPFNVQSTGSEFGQNRIHTNSNFARRGGICLGLYPEWILDRPVKEYPTGYIIWHFARPKFAFKETFYYLKQDSQFTFNTVQMYSNILILLWNQIQRPLWNSFSRIKYFQFQDMQVSALRKKYILWMNFVVILLNDFSSRNYVDVVICLNVICYCKTWAKYRRI